MRDSDTAVSEMVGSLFLILIVAVSATSFGMFVHEKQKETTAQQQLELERSLELIDVLGATPTLNDTFLDRWVNFNFTVASVHNRPSKIFGVELNGQKASYFWVERFNRTSQAWEWTGHRFNETVDLLAHERARISINLTASFFEPAPLVLTTDAVDFVVQTVRLNTFRGTFLPPSSLALLRVESLWNGTAFAETVILDGSQSDHPSATGRVIRWEWTVEDTVTMTTTTYIGRVVRAYQCNTNEYDITLKVWDNHGFMASDTVAGFAC